MPRAILAAALKSEIEKGIKKSGSAKNGAGLSGRLEMPTPNKVKIRNAKNADASAVTASAGDTHVVGIGNLRVAIESDGKSWTAQGLEIDYIAQGSDLEDAKKQFEDGLACTIHQHLRIYGNIDKLLSPAPREVWKEVLNPKAIRARYSQISIHAVIKEAFGFEKVDYLILAAAA